MMLWFLLSREIPQSTQRNKKIVIYMAREIKKFFTFLKLGDFPP
jgi:hypothetical protein